MKMTVNEVLKSAPGARLPFGSPNVECEGATVDSRNVPEGAIFFGIRGETQDGSHYAPDALRAGAAAAVINEKVWAWLEGEFMSIGKPVIVTPNTLDVLQGAGRVALTRSGARVVGVTGATGKTTTKDILTAMLRAAGARAEGTPGNQNTDIGVPLALMGMAGDTEVMVVEMGMRGMGQIAELAALAPPSVACITSIGPVHLELLGTVENVAAAKFEILQALQPGGVAVVPESDPYLDPLVETLDDEVRVIRFGDRPTVDLDLNLSTAWQLRCAAAAEACCLGLGIRLEPGLTVDVALSAMRGSIRDLAVGGVLIEDCYNANPIAMRAAIDDLVGRPGRHVVILGDMMELGGGEADFHREVGELARERGVDALIGVGTRAAWYVKGFGDGAVHYPSVDDALGALGAHVQAGDTVLVKGSRSMALERVTAVLAGDA